jgi:hypothetical protein
LPIPYSHPAPSTPSSRNRRRGRERLRERLGHQLRRGLGIERAPGEEREHRFGVPLEQHAEQLRLA